MIKFANMSIVLSASGKTKTLMICSLVSLVANAGCNVLFYHIFGFIGPAIATVFVTVILTAVLAEMSAKSLETSVWPELHFARREHIGCTVDYVSGRNRYMGYLISLGIYSFKGVKVGLDCANGSSWNIAKSVFDALGADTYVINNKPNGLNINNNAGSTHIEGLQKFVVEKGLDIGFAYDGDADRCLCVDEKGNVITGDHILYIYGCYMKERGKLLTNTVVNTVMSNFGLGMFPKQRTIKKVGANIMRQIPVQTQPEYGSPTIGESCAGCKTACIPQSRPSPLCAS